MSQSAGSEVAVVASYELRAMLGARGLFVLLGYASVAFFSGWAMVFVTNQLTAKMEAAVSSESLRAQVLAQLDKAEFREQARPALEWFNAQQLYDAVVAGQIPWLVAFVLLMSAFILSGLTFVAAHDRISSDLTSGFSRFVFQRVRRETYLLGKLIGVWGGVMLSVMATHLVLIAFGSSNGNIDIKELTTALPKAWAGTAVFVLAYTSFGLAASATLGRPFAVLALGSCLLFLTWSASLMSPVFRSVWMGSWDVGLWVLDPIAALVFLVHTVIFFGIALWGITRRDV